MGNKIITIGSSSSASNVDDATNQSYVYKDISMIATLKADVNTLSVSNDIAYTLAKESTLENIVTESTDELILLYMKTSQTLSKKAYDYVCKLRKLSYDELREHISVKADGFDGNSISVFSV